MNHTQEETLETTQALKWDFEMIAWGLFFVWWGMTDSDVGLFSSLPHGTSAIGIGLILLGLNVARSLKRRPIGGFTTTVGILALVLGGLQLANSIVALPFKIPVFAILLIVLGGIFLVRELLRVRMSGFQTTQ